MLNHLNTWIIVKNSMKHHYLKKCLRCLLPYVLDVPCALTALTPYVSSALRALVPRASHHYLKKCLRCPLPYMLEVPCALTALMLYVSCALRPVVPRASLTSCLTRSRASRVLCLAFSRDVRASIAPHPPLV